jgi:hypothetical protein
MNTLATKGFPRRLFNLSPTLTLRKKKKRHVGILLERKLFVCLKLLFHVFHTCGLAIVFVIEAVVVEHILSIVWRPLPGIILSVNMCAGASVWQNNLNNLTFVIQRIDIL